jgi:hypothetical protein
MTVRQTFTGGAACEITQKPREADVVFQCDPETKFARFASIQEFTICKFVVLEWPNKSATQPLTSSAGTRCL